MVWKPAEDPLSKLAKAMVMSAQQVWFSSLSNVLKTQQGVGRQLTEMLRLDSSPADEPREDADLAALKNDSVQEFAERDFKTRLVPLLQRGDVANRVEIEKLTREVEALTRRVEALCREREGSND